MSKLGLETYGVSVSLYRVEEKLYFNLKIEDRDGNFISVPFATSRTDYSPIKLVLRDEDERVLWTSEIPERDLND